MSNPHLYRGFGNSRDGVGVSVGVKENGKVWEVWVMWLRRFDEWLIDRVFQAIADWFVLNLGWDCFLLARGCRIAFGIGMACYACWVDKVWWERLMSGFLMLWSLVIGLWGNELEPSPMNGTRNIKRLTEVGWRLIFLGFMAMDCILFIFWPTWESFGRRLPFWFAGCSYYFAACDPMPPVQHETIREMAMEGAN